MSTQTPTRARARLVFPAHWTPHGGLRVPLDQGASLEVLPGHSAEEMCERAEAVLREAFGRECVVEVMG